MQKAYTAHHWRWKPWCWKVMFASVGLNKVDPCETRAVLALSSHLLPCLVCLPSPSVSSQLPRKFPFLNSFPPRHSSPSYLDFVCLASSLTHLQTHPLSSVSLASFRTFYCSWASLTLRQAAVPPLHLPLHLTPPHASRALLSSSSFRQKANWSCLNKWEVSEII